MVTLNTAKAEKVDRNCCLSVGTIVNALIDKVKSVVQAFKREVELTKQDFKMTFKRDTMFVCDEDGLVYEIDTFVGQKRSEIFGAQRLEPLAKLPPMELEDMVL